MKLKSWMTLALLIVPLAGCATMTPSGDYCDIAYPIYFGNADTIDWLLGNDRNLLVDTIVHNETHARLCLDE